MMLSLCVFVAIAGHPKPPLPPVPVMFNQSFGSYMVLQVSENLIEDQQMEADTDSKRATTIASKENQLIRVPRAVQAAHGAALLAELKRKMYLFANCTLSCKYTLRLLCHATCTIVHRTRA